MTSPFNLEEFLDDNLGPVATDPDLIKVIALDPFETDPRLKLLSHSSRNTLHKCPRKYQLYRLRIEAQPEEENSESNITFSYGSAVGVGIQSIIQNKSFNQVVLDTFLAWRCDLDANNPKQNKSFYTALYGVIKAADIFADPDSSLHDYELVYYNGKPAVELSFQINLPKGYKYRGFVDAVLRHKITGEILVLELKTTSGVANAATYKNSGQAIGYSVVLDILFPSLSSYTVLYLVYQSKDYVFKELPFTKSLLQRALWLQELLIDQSVIELYNSYEVFPMHGGDVCFDFYKPCEYLDRCTLNTSSLAKPLTQAMLNQIEAEEANYQFIVDFDSLVEAQISKGEYL